MRCTRDLVPTGRLRFPSLEWIAAEDLAVAALLTVDEALARLPACLR
jgi:hypothetical protein